MTAASFSFSRVIFHPRRAPRRQVEKQAFEPNPEKYTPEYIASYVDPRTKRHRHYKGGGTWSHYSYGGSTYRR